MLKATIFFFALGAIAPSGPWPSSSFTRDVFSRPHTQSLGPLATESPCIFNEEGPSTVKLTTVPQPSLSS